MRLQAWRDAWIPLALTACGGHVPAWQTQPSPTKVTIYDAPPLAGATYVATVDAGDFGHPGPRVALEHGSFQCTRLVDLMMASGYDKPAEEYLVEARKTCDDETAKLLRQNGGFVFVFDGKGKRWMTAAELLAAASPIDSPAKALLAVWVDGRYQLGWSDGERQYGGADDGLAREIAGGFEVVGSMREEESNCGSENARQTVTNYRATLLVDRAGKVTEREKSVSNRYDVADPCHPMGRRPADFVDVPSGGTVQGHLVRALHHEAESVRAFQRIARELAAHGAPEELWRAAMEASDDERDHAERCGRMTGLAVTIADDHLPTRSLVDLAIDNVAEGCVGEAYAALANLVQARTAATPELRAHFSSIASDELAHAALAYAIADWIHDRLTIDERARVEAARDQALTALRRSYATAPTEASRTLGMPTGRASERLLATIGGALTARIS